MLKRIKEYLYHEPEEWARIGVGHFVGGSALLALAAYLYLAFNALRKLQQFNVLDQLITLLVMSFTLAVIIRALRYAYRLVTGKRS